VELADLMATRAGSALREAQARMARFQSREAHRLDEAFEPVRGINMKVEVDGSIAGERAAEWFDRMKGGKEFTVSGWLHPNDPRPHGSIVAEQEALREREEVVGTADWDIDALPDSAERQDGESQDAWFARLTHAGYLYVIEERRDGAPYAKWFEPVI
jgi:hypothetical protein